MTTILFAFISALLLSLVLTPAARWLGVRFGDVDEPGERKVHIYAIPRNGGAAIFLSFFLALFACTFLMTHVSDLLVWDDKRLFAVLGALVVFSVGFYLNRDSARLFYCFIPPCGPEKPGRLPIISLLFPTPTLPRPSRGRDTFCS